VEYVEKELEQTQQFVQSASNGSTGDAVNCHDVKVLLLVSSVADVLREQGEKKQ
jgi:hypothetical protein